MSLNIKLATETDELAELGQWIYMTDSVFTFNYSEIEKEFKKGRLLIAKARLNDWNEEIVGFCSMEDNFTPHFFEIMSECRGKKYGEALFKKVMKLASEHGTTTMEMECSPRESYDFWCRQGFALKGSMEEDKLMVSREIPNLNANLNIESTSPQTKEPLILKTRKP